MDENSSVQKDQETLKRKHSDDQCYANKGGEPVATQSEPQSATIVVIDDDGDLYMDLPGGKLKVSRKVLTLTSPVFRAMLGAGSKFAETARKVFAPDGIHIVSFGDDDFETMKIITRITHLQTDQVPESLSFDQLYQIAVLCDKYDLKRCLGQWPNTWAAPYLDSFAKDGFQRWLFMSIVFQFAGLYKKVTRHFILHSRLDKDRGTLTRNNFDISEGISGTRLGSPPLYLNKSTLSDIRVAQIRQARADVALRVHSLIWQEYDGLRHSQRAPVCKVHGERQDMCDSMNLGCLHRVFPTIVDPNAKGYRCLCEVTAYVNHVSRIQEGVNFIAYRFGDHKACAVGPRLVQGVQKVLDAVEGLELEKS